MHLTTTPCLKVRLSRQFAYLLYVTHFLEPSPQNKSLDTPQFTPCGAASNATNLVTDNQKL